MEELKGFLNIWNMEKAAGIYTAICTKRLDNAWSGRQRMVEKSKKDNEKVQKYVENSDITMYVGLRGFFDIDDGESDPWKDKTYEDFLYWRLFYLKI